MWTGCMWPRIRTSERSSETVGSVKVGGGGI
jgi:hypothetical protein